jgi:DNA repair protein RadC
MLGETGVLTRFDLTGPACGAVFEDGEVLAELLSGRKADRRARALAMLDVCGSAAELCQLDAAELALLGLARAEITRLRAALELGRRAVVRPQKGAILSPQDALACVAPSLVGAENERFVVVVLDVKNRPRRVAQVAQGGVDACPVDPREVFVHAVRERGSGVIVAHNHPSGDPTPSPEDIALTERLQQAGSVLGVPLLDHIIVGHGGTFTSLAARGLLSQVA